MHPRNQHGPRRGGSLRRKAAALLAGAATVFATAVAASPPAHALPPEIVPAIGVDTGRFKLPIVCKIGLGTQGRITVFNLRTDVDVQGVAPVQLGPGQEFWLTQGSGSITFPNWLIRLAGVVNINKADATITELNIGASNSTPSQINVAQPPTEIKDIPIEPGRPLKVGLPLEGTFDVGPYKAPGSGKVTLQFLGAKASIMLKAPRYSVPVTADCQASEGNALLTIAVGGAPGQPPAKIHGAPLDFSEPASNELVGIINAPYKCTLNGEPLDVGIAVGAHIPLVVKRNGSFSFSKASGALVIPAATVNRMLDKGHTTAAGKVTRLDLNVEGGTPAVQNVAAAGIDIPQTTLVRDRELLVSLPVDGTLTAGPFAPTATAPSVAVSLGSAAAEFRFNGSSTTTPVTCGTPSPTVYLVENPVT